MPAERNIAVVSPIGIAWSVKFYTVQAAWRRVIASQRRVRETDMACEARIRKEGWKVVVPTKMA